MIQCLRAGIRAIRSSPQRRSKYVRACKLLEPSLKPVQLVLDVRTRWDSTYNMLRLAVKQQKAYDGTVAYDPEMEKYRLDQRGWDLIAQIQEFLAPFAQYQKKMSAQKYPTINVAVSSYNKLFNHLDQYSSGTVAVSDIVVDFFSLMVISMSDTYSYLLVSPRGTSRCWQGFPEAKGLLHPGSAASLPHIPGDGPSVLV